MLSPVLSKIWSLHATPTINLALAVQKENRVIDSISSGAGVDGVAVKASVTFINGIVREESFGYAVPAGPDDYHFVFAHIPTGLDAAF